jgi:acetyl esterase/lipase
MHMENGKSLLLWPQGAPFAKGSAPEDCPKITPYLVKSATPTATVVVCPGGGYTRHAPHEGEPVARWLNRAGVSAFVLNYRVAPYQHPCELLDAQRGIRFVRFHARECNLDPKRVGILGFSAGGHLASSAGTHYDKGKPSPDPIEREGCRPDLMILCYAVITFGEHRHNGCMVNLLGKDAPEDMRNLLSNEKQVTADTPPTFLWHTENDAGVPVENSLLFAQALRRHKVSFEMHIFKAGRHGLGLAPDDPHVGTWTRLCEEWLKKQGFAK